MSDFTPELKRILRAAGCWFVRHGNGDHEIWRSPITARNFPVDGKIKSRHTAAHAGFTLAAAVGGSPPASVRYIRAFNRLMFSARAGRRLEWQVGTDPLRDYLATELSRWGATRTGDRWVWRDSAADESVALIYQPAGPRAGRAALLRPEAELIIVHYTPPAPPSSRWR